MTDQSCLTKYVVCDSPTEVCYFGDCKNFSGFEEVKEEFEEASELNCIESIIYRQRVQVENGTTLERFVKPTEEHIF